MRPPILPLAAAVTALAGFIAVSEIGIALAHDTGHGAIALGDSIDYGLGASSPDKAYVPQFHNYNRQ